MIFIFRYICENAKSKQIIYGNKAKIVEKNMFKHLITLFIFSKSTPNERLVLKWAKHYTQKQKSLLPTIKSSQNILKWKHKFTLQPQVQQKYKINRANVRDG